MLFAMLALLCARTLLVDDGLAVRVAAARRGPLALLRDILHYARTLRSRLMLGLALTGRCAPTFCAAVVALSAWRARVVVNLVVGVTGLSLDVG